MTLLDILKRGSRQAIHLEELSQRLNVSTDTVKRTVQKERLQGFPICSDLGGYYLPETKTELQETIRTLELQAKSRLQCAKVLKERLSDFENNG